MAKNNKPAPRPRETQQAHQAGWHSLKGRSGYAKGTTSGEYLDLRQTYAANPLPGKRKPKGDKCKLDHAKELGGAGNTVRARFETD